MMMNTAIAAADKLEKEGVSVELVDLRTISPIDKDTILESVAKTSRLVIAHEAVKQGGVGGEIAAIVAEEGLDYLDAPILRVGAPFTPIPFARPLEQAYRITADHICDKIRTIC
jgi:pyruvate dehydrogenase E1 component beta subunit